VSRRQSPGRSSPISNDTNRRKTPTDDHARTPSYCRAGRSPRARGRSRWRGRRLDAAREDRRELLTSQDGFIGVARWKSAGAGHRRLGARRAIPGDYPQGLRLVTASPATSSAVSTSRPRLGLSAGRPQKSRERCRRTGFDPISSGSRTSFPPYAHPPPRWSRRGECPTAVGSRPCADNRSARRRDRKRLSDRHRRRRLRRAGAAGHKHGGHRRLNRHTNVISPSPRLRPAARKGKGYRSSSSGRKAHGSIVGRFNGADPRPHAIVGSPTKAITARTTSVCARRARARISDTRPVGMRLGAALNWSRQIRTARSSWPGIVHLT